MGGRSASGVKRPYTALRVSRKQCGQAADDSLVESLAHDASLERRQRVGHLSGKLPHPCNDGVRLEADPVSAGLPVSRGDVLDPIRGPDPHGESQPAVIEIGVGQCAGEVIEGRESDPPPDTVKQRVVLGVPVRPGHQPVEDERVGIGAACGGSSPSTSTLP